MQLVHADHWRSQDGQEKDRQGDDRMILAAFEEAHPWGMETFIDLLECSPWLVQDPDHLRGFLAALCDHIGMRRYGEPTVVHFGDEPRVSGWTGIQLIETSNLNVHLIDEISAGCINIFSCSPYPPVQAAQFCQQWFEAQEVRFSVVFRVFTRPVPAR